jgi:hypothetical protein
MLRHEGRAHVVTVCSYKPLYVMLAAMLLLWQVLGSRYCCSGNKHRCSALPVQSVMVCYCALRALNACTSFVCSRLTG